MPPFRALRLALRLEFASLIGALLATMTAVFALMHTATAFMAAAVSADEAQRLLLVLALCGGAFGVHYHRGLARPDLPREWQDVPEAVRRGHLPAHALDRVASHPAWPAMLRGKAAATAATWLMALSAVVVAARPHWLWMGS